MVNIDDTIPGAPNFRWREFFRSATAEAMKVNNVPLEGSEVWGNVQYLAENVLQPLRDEFGPIKINSGYRSTMLNLMVGGSRTSFHSYGMAADIVPLVKGVKLIDIFKWLHARPFTELIAEEVPGGWIHVAYARGRENERQLKYKPVGGTVRRMSYDKILEKF